MGTIMLWSIIYALLGGLVFILGLNFLKFVPRNLQDIYKIGLPVVFLILFLLSRKFLPDQRPVFLAFFLVSLGWVLDFYLTGRIVDSLSANRRTVSGIAITMVISTVLVSASVIIGWLLAGEKLSTIYLQGSNHWWGSAVGLLGLLIFGGLGILQALGRGLGINGILAALPMALVFSLANGFREELAYRAIFLEGYQANIGAIAAITVTTLVFTLAHLEVSYDPASLIIFTIVLVLIGIVGSLIMIKTESLIGAVIFHTGADVLLIMGLLSSGQLTL